ncbi:MAG: glucose-6-phosphate dehydrogenase assembly protein OpcA [Acidobacteria bacterium]|nr:glucose-6-phosphate dehydrogenase assembly protein OpcA [Acidobacteriota bacterium]
MSAAVTPERILNELSELWVSLGKADENGVLRASAMTLIVAAEESEDASLVGEGLAHIMHEHPSRAIVLRVREGDPQALESRVLAQCWMPFGKRQQICCEQIEITCGEIALRDVPRIVLGLTEPDLPVVLVCRPSRLFRMGAFAGMFPVAGKIIADSRSLRSPLGMLFDLEARRREGRNIIDLAWTALTEWRESISCLFEDADLAARIPGVRAIAVTHGDHPAPSEAWYLAAWLARSTGPGVEVSVQSGQSAHAIQSVEMLADGLSLSLSRASGPILHVARNGIANSMPFAVSSDWDLLRAELAILGRDRVYEDVLPRAVALAGG